MNVPVKYFMHVVVWVFLHSTVELDLHVLIPILLRLPIQPHLWERGCAVQEAKRARRALMSLQWWGGTWVDPRPADASTGPWLIWTEVLCMMRPREH
eukprot:2215400-Rhodomonas_salina.2